VILAAIAARTPLLVSDIGGMAELVPDGVAGRHFRAGDPDDLARVLRELAERPEGIGELSRRFPPVKSIEENGREMEFRYRALAALRAGVR
jgi:glycosyltransferase involved in cell wall biosynthesis